MNQNNILKYLVPVIAVVVLFESVVLISRLKDKNSVMPVESKPTVAQTGDSAPKGDEVYQIKLEAAKASFKVGESGDIKVKMSGMSEKSLDSINVYVKYDPTLLEVKDMTFDKRLPAPAFSKVSTLRGLLVANFLVSDPKGLKLAAKDELMLMSFNMKALKPGKHVFEISTGKEMKESATMIVENGTSKPLTFSSNKLTVNVSE